MDMDITKPLPFEDGSVEFILAEHLIEHVTAPEALRFFQEAYRILEVGGVLRVCCPCVISNADLSMEERIDLTVNHGHLQILNFSSLNAFFEMAGFDYSNSTNREECDGHWKVIGKEKDDNETIRVEATK